MALQVSLSFLKLSSWEHIWSISTVGHKKYMTLDDVVPSTVRDYHVATWGAGFIKKQNTFT